MHVHVLVPGMCMKFLEWDCVTLPTAMSWKRLLRLKMSNRAVLFLLGCLISSNIFTAILASWYGSSDCTRNHHYICEDQSFKTKTYNSSHNGICHTACPPEVKHLPTLYIITPTYHRLTQTADLVSFCNTLILVPKVVWIVVEDSAHKTVAVDTLLRSCGVETVHLNVPSTNEFQEGFSFIKWIGGLLGLGLSSWERRVKGVEQRNAGLQWLRENCDPHSCNGVVYFADDDNTFSLKLFKMIRETGRISVFPVAFVGRVRFEGPRCKDGHVESWRTAFERRFPIDMAGFAINLRLILENAQVKFGRDKHGKVSRKSYMENDFLGLFQVPEEEFECLGTSTEVVVWHTKTVTPNIYYEYRILNPEDDEVRL